MLLTVTLAKDDGQTFMFFFQDTDIVALRRCLSDMAIDPDYPSFGAPQAAEVYRRAYALACPQFGLDPAA